MESLLNLALLSRSSYTLARVLSWAHTYGGPGFSWAWRAAGAYGITPLLRMQVSWTCCIADAFVFSLCAHGLVLPQCVS